MNITGVLLAAGTSKRMSGANKLMLPYRSGSIVEESLKNLIASSVSQTLVVLGHEKALISKLLTPYESALVTFVSNDNYQTGRASSVRCAIRNLDISCDAALFMVADKPGVRTELIVQAVNEFEKHRPLLLCVRTRWGRGHPIVFARKLFDDLLNMEGDQYGQKVTEKYQNKVHWLDDDLLQINVNTREDYERLIEQDSQTRGIEASERHGD